MGGTSWLSRWSMVRAGRVALGALPGEGGLGGLSSPKTRPWMHRVGPPWPPSLDQEASLFH